MAKKKAPDGASKKNVQKKKAQLVEDKTFGLKNKNKSKKVQNLVNSVERNVMNSGDQKARQQEEQRKQAKGFAKARKKQALDEQNALFGEALQAVQKKQTNQQAGKQEAQGRDGNDANEKKSTSRAMKMMFQMDAQEMDDKLREDPNYVPTLEDDIEAKRQKMVAELKKSGTGTPITPETFKVWQDIKIAKRQAAAKKLVEAEFRKKKGGKGLSILSGRALYEYKRELFRDRGDDEADGIDEAPATANGNVDKGPNVVEEVTAQVQSDLFLDGDDDDLDDMED